MSILLGLKQHAFFIILFVLQCIQKHICRSNIVLHLLNVGNEP